MQSKDPSIGDLKSIPSKKKPADVEEVKVVEQIPTKESNDYENLLES